jgi:hypothetical protein
LCSLELVLGLLTILQLPEGVDASESVREPVIPPGGVVAKPSIARNTPAKQRVKASKTRRLNANLWRLISDF